MISKNEIDAYMSIKAPEALKHRVLSEETQKNNRISSIVHMCYALAAVLLIFIAIFTFMPSSKTAVYYGDTLLDKNAVIIDAANSNAEIALLSVSRTKELPLYFETDETTTVTVSNGCLYVLEDDNVINAGSSAVINKNTNVMWSADLDIGTESYILTVETKDSSSSYCISQNKNAQWVIKKNNF